MEYGEPDGPLPEIPSLDEVGAAFPVLLATLVPQPSIREIGVNTIVSSRDGVVDAQARRSCTRSSGTPTTSTTR